MKRLTKKLEKDYYGNDVYGAVYDGSATVGLIKANQKLGRLEDLEEQLGMPLEVWHYIYDGNPIYFIGNGRKPIELFLHDDCMESFKFNLPNKSVVYVMLHASDYKKYWFLSREEAEQALEAQSKRVEPCG